MHKLIGMVEAMALVALAAGCDGDDDPVDPGETSMCAEETRADAYAAGMEKQGDKGLIRVRLVAGEPAPPAKGENAWTLQITDAAGAPVDGATIVVTPRMPDHGHGSAKTPVVTAGGAAGEYEVTAIDLAMAGFWTVAVEVTTAAGESDTVTFGFCVEG